MMSPSTLALFAQLLNAYQIPAGHPQIVEVAQAITVARTELAQALDATELPVPTTTEATSR